MLDCFLKNGKGQFFPKNIYIYIFYLSTHINKIYFNRYEKYEIETSCINFMRIILLQILRCEKKTTAYLEI